ncbi:hypothetical protein EVAR_85378_1 [Eumeta japonica]|uniref:Uncharacterized protein n=1 Tax=Eumeta variegata TaxID=151549 RepID=A0A4C1WVI6_EUMVA|nr:hypothetical protein EVAR_85378_1 [Eumeta japonica]
MEMKVLLENDLRVSSTRIIVFTLATTQDIGNSFPKQRISSPLDIQDDRLKAAYEMQSYCALPTTKRDDDPFQWWSRNSSSTVVAETAWIVTLIPTRGGFFSLPLTVMEQDLVGEKPNRLRPPYSRTRSRAT